MINTGTGIQTFESIRDGMHMRTEFAQTIVDMKDKTYSLIDGVVTKAHEISLWE